MVWARARAAAAWVGECPKVVLQLEVVELVIRKRGGVIESLQDAYFGRRDGRHRGRGGHFGGGRVGWTLRSGRY